jgi:hypothetical protein
MKTGQKKTFFLKRSGKFGVGNLNIVLLAASNWMLETGDWLLAAMNWWLVIGSW